MVVCSSRFLFLIDPGTVRDLFGNYPGLELGKITHNWDGCREEVILRESDNAAVMFYAPMCWPSI